MAARTLTARVGETLALADGSRRFCNGVGARCLCKAMNPMLIPPLPLPTAELASVGHWFDVPEGSALECLAIGGEQQRVYVVTIEPPVEYE